MRPRRSSAANEHTASVQVHHHLQKGTLSREESAFYDCLQEDFDVFQLLANKICILHSVDVPASYYDTPAVTNRSDYVMKIYLESIWINGHGAPHWFESDFEFQSGPMKIFMTTHQNRVEESSV